MLPLTLSAFKNGMNVSLSKIFNPNNGLSSYSQFFEAVHSVVSYETPLEDTVNKVVTLFQQANIEDSLDVAKVKKLKFNYLSKDSFSFCVIKTSLFHIIALLLSLFQVSLTINYIISLFFPASENYSQLHPLLILIKFLKSHFKRPRISNRNIVFCSLMKLRFDLLFLFLVAS